MLYLCRVAIFHVFGIPDKVRSGKVEVYCYPKELSQFTWNALLVFNNPIPPPFKEDDVKMYFYLFNEYTIIKTKCFPSK